MIIAEMKQPDSVRELSPMPPSPVPTSLHRSNRHSSKKKKRRREEELNESDNERISRKRLTHQNSTGFDPGLAAASSAGWPPTSSVEGQSLALSTNSGNATRKLKAEFAYNPEEGYVM